MDDHSDDIFADIDALLKQTATRLPPPEERRRLRQAAGLAPEEVARVLRVEPDLLEAWESGWVDPSPADRARYARLMNGLAQQHADTSTDGPQQQPTRPAPAASPQHVPPAAGPTWRPAPPPPTGGGRTGRHPAQGTSTEVFPAGPLAVLDAAGDELTAYLSGGTTLPVPSDTLTSAGYWALQAGLGQPRLSSHGHRSDPLIVLSRSAADYLGLPPELPDRAGLRLPADHPQVVALREDGWSLTRSGLGPWTRMYLPIQAGRRRSIQLAILSWGALSNGGWEGAPVDAGPGQLARWLGLYAGRVLTPRGSTAVCGQELMTALRPPTKPERDPASGNWTSGRNAGALWGPVEPAPPEAPALHPLAQGRAPGDAMEEEAYDWYRLPDEVEARTYSWAVGIDINLAFLAAANSLAVGLNEPARHVTSPAFDNKIPGCWYVDLSHVPVDPRLPSPFTATGKAPTGPAWYATPTLAYAVELGATVQPIAAWLRFDSGRYLNPWYKHLREAYLVTMRDLGITEDMAPRPYLAAMNQLPGKNPAILALLSAIKATAKGGIGKLRAGPRDATAPYTRWPALDTATWRPDIRAAIISRARANLHRKMTKTADLTGRYPLAVLSDCVVYPATRPTALDVVPHTDDGQPIPGTFRLGVLPGYAKQEGAQTMPWLTDLARAHDNAARFIKASTIQPPGNP